MTRTGTGLVVLAAAALMSHAGCKHSESAARQSPTAGADAMAAQDHAAAAAAQPSATPQATATASEVQGRIESIDRGNNVTLAGSEAIGHAFDRFKADEDTRVTVGGDKADLADLAEGDEVRASFSTSGGELHLDRVDVLKPADVSGSR
jgi:Cu/Ag efflux protein CusF